MIAVAFYIHSSKQQMRFTVPQVCLPVLLRNNWVETISNGRENNHLMKSCNEVKHVDEEGVFVCRTGLLICKAHANVGSVTCHLRGRRSISNMAFCICQSPSPSAGGREKQPFSLTLLSTGSDIIYSPHLMATHPPTVNGIRPTHIAHKGGYIPTHD